MNFVDVLSEQPGNTEEFNDVLEQPTPQWQPEVPIIEASGYSPYSETPPSNTVEDVLRAMQAGVNEAPTYVLAHGEQPQYQPTTEYGRWAKTGTNLLATLPYYVVGGAGGALAAPITGNPEVAPLTSTMGAFVLPRVVEEIGKQHHEGKLSYDDLVQAVGEELAKAVVFHYAGEAGGKALSRFGKLAEKTGRVGMEGASLAFLASPGKMPTGKDILDSVSTLAALGITHATVGKVFKFAVKGGDPNKLVEAVKNKHITPEEADKILEGEKVDSKSVWGRMPDALVKQNAEMGIPEAKAEWEKRLEEKKKLGDGGEEGKVKIIPGKVTRSRTFLSKTAEWKEKLGKEEYYKILNGLGVKKSNQIVRAQDKKLVLDLLKKRYEELNPPSKKEAKSKETKKDVTFIGMQETPDGKSIPIVNLDKSTIKYNPKEHNIVNIEEYNKAIEEKPIKLGKPLQEQPIYGKKITKDKPIIKEKVKLKETGQVIEVERDANEVLKELSDKKSRYEGLKNKLDKFRECMGM